MRLSHHTHCSSLKSQPGCLVWEAFLTLLMLRLSGTPPLHAPRAPGPAQLGAEHALGCYVFTFHCWPVSPQTWGKLHIFAIFYLNQAF